MEGLRGLIYMNPLIVDKISKKFLYWKDSGFIFTKNLIKGFPENTKYYWLIPEKIHKEKDFKWFLEASPNIEFIPYPYPSNIHQNRYEFYGNIIRKHFPYTVDVDFIINNQPEVSANLKTWSINQRRDKPIIVSFYHWIDCDKSREFSKELGGYFLRQYEGAEHSDLNMFHNKYAYSLFNGEAEKIFKNPEIKNIHYFNSPPTNFGYKAIELPDKKIILFNHRLNNSTNWKFVLNELKGLYKERQDFILWFTDENEIQSKVDPEKYPFAHFETLRDENYGFLISKSHFSVCAHRTYSTWNLAVLDAMENGCFTLLPDTPGDIYNFLFKDYKKLGIFHNFNNFKKKVNQLLDINIEELNGLNSFIRNHSPYFRERDLGKEIYQLIVGKIKERIPEEIKKYDEVKRFIEEKGTATKYDWVNEFWSFHVNSNFQKIRWKLLNDGLNDNISKLKTEYYA
jgi:hypothetical protein